MRVRGPQVPQRGIHQIHPPHVDKHRLAGGEELSVSSQLVQGDVYSDRRAELLGQACRTENLPDPYP